MLTRSSCGVLLLGLLLGGCGSAGGGAGSADANLLDRSSLEGRETVVHPVSSGRPDEVCVLPTGLPGADYGQDDLEDEEELCAFDFYRDAPIPDQTPVGICAKTVSTNPGTDVYELLDGQKQADVKAICSAEDPENDLEAKFKQSISCSYTPSILGYYHLSRALGGAGNVYPAVLRTMDLEKHKGITAMGISQTRAGDLINTIWKQYQRAEAAPESYSKRDALFTSDFLQIYGALQKNPKKEVKYSEINKRGDASSPSAFTAPFRATTAFKRMQDSRKIGDIVGSQGLETAPIVVQMKDIADMILMDHILSQGDRFGNIHAFDYYYYLENGQIEKIKKSKVDDGEAALPAGAVLVRELLLKDNDCGVIKQNMAEGANLLSMLRHMSFDTYRHFRAFKKMFFEDPSAGPFFRNELRFTDSDIAKVARSLASAESILVNNCKAGTLKLDLNLDAHVAGTNSTSIEQCDALGMPEE